jgi:3-methyladenine DNA glycosylase AlkD
MTMEKSLLADIRRAIETMTNCRHPQPERRFHKHDEYLSYGLRTPDFHRMMKTFRPRFLAFSLQERLDLAVQFLREHVGELGHVGIHVVALSVKELSPEHLGILDGLPEDFRSWSHVDHFCGEVMMPLLWKYREETLVLLEQWSESPIRWKRRASVVTFTRKVGKSGEFTAEVLKICKKLARDTEDIVRKGVGWALKDNLRPAPERILPFIEDLRRQGVSSTVILYALRGVKGAEREKILSIPPTPK